MHENTPFDEAVGADVDLSFAHVGKGIDPLGANLVGIIGPTIKSILVEGGKEALAAPHGIESKGDGLSVYFLRRGRHGKFVAGC